MAGQATVRGFRIGEQTIEVGDTEGKTLKQVMDELGVRIEGNSFLINGRRLSGSEVGSARLKSGDEVQVAKEGRGGLVIRVVEG